MRNVLEGVSSSAILSPTLSHSRDANDRCNKVVLWRTSFPDTYHTFAGILFIETGIFRRTCSSPKFKSVTPIFKHPIKI